MIVQLTLTICAIFIWLWFNVEVIIEKKQIPYCISDSYYALDSKGWIFVIVMLFQVITLAYPVLTLPWEIESFSIFKKLFLWAIGGLFLIGIGVVSISPEYKHSGTQYRNHFIGSLVAMIGSQLWVGFIFPWAYLLWLIPCGWAIYSFNHTHSDKCTIVEKEMFDKGDYLWWFEIGMFLSTYTALLTKIISLL